MLGVKNVGTNNNFLFRFLLRIDHRHGRDAFREVAADPRLDSYCAAAGMVGA